MRNPRAVAVILTLLCFVGDAWGTKYGIIGFGISLYPDLCCQACHDSLSTLSLNCTTFGSDGDMSGMDMGGSEMDMGTTSDDCRASNTPWLQTMAYCIQQNCDAVGYPAEKQAACFSVQAVAGASEPTFESSLPVQPPTVELSADDMWLNVTSLVNSDLYASTYGTLAEFTREEVLHSRYALIVYFVVIGLCIIAGVLVQITSRLPGAHHKQPRSSKFVANLRRHITLPALFGNRRLEPLPGNTGYLPGRVLSIFIALYVVLNVILSAVSFRSFQPNVWFMSSGFELCEYVGNRTGVLSLANMTIAILFSGRNNLLLALTGWSQTTFLALHRWAARVATVQAVVHSIVYTLAYFEPGYDGASAYAAKAAEPFYYWGIIATIAMCLAVGFAILPLRINFYETFLALHIVLVVVTLVGCWYHLVPHFGFDYGYQVWLYIAFAFWAADRLARLARLAFYNRFGSAEAVVEAIPDTNVLQITVFPRTISSFGPGQHSFLYFVGLGRFWESHPFSVAGWTGGASAPATIPSLSSPVSSNSDEQEKQISSVATTPHGTNPRPHSNSGRPSLRFLTRVHSGATATLQQRLYSSSSPVGSPRMEISVYNEGPYAGHRATLQPLYTADTILCLVGGIGITNALGYVQEYSAIKNVERQTGGNETSESTTSGQIMKRAKRFILAWTAREMALIRHVEQNILGDVEGVEYAFWCTGSVGIKEKKGSSDNGHDAGAGDLAPVTMGRMDLRTVIRSAVERGHETAVMLCGPGAMADAATREVVDCLKDGFAVHLNVEEFAW
ncbi:hypothetical protein CONLIGDRAFT_636726 [Coniochaeta ligniaria NRRL 30616]|uniref:FAD-binding FR-type domain-containing protein n=1 Tax=Coniochaeta ligniaria NRRL 30616 TaxID=1408157 RepID=A0A1J7IB80_9PEZI|nr:hypothetical protein CONLIGDRAFT_636726 [Coniochaeta ligniaria NRRL 30616]